MWSRRAAGGARVEVEGAYRPGSRRAYYRVEGRLPIRLRRLDPEDVEAAVFDLSLPDPLLQPIEEEGEDTALMARLRRIEEKLDLLLGQSLVEVPRPLSGSDRVPVVFSGAGLALDVETPYQQGEAVHVEMLLPPPYVRTLRAVGTTVSDSASTAAPGRPGRLAIALTHMDDEERDALVAYSYDVQRFQLRSRGESGAEVAP